MKQLINLYHVDTEKQEKYPVNTIVILKFSAIFVGLLLLHTLYLEWRHISIEREVKELETKQAELEKALHEKEAILTNKEAKELKDRLIKEASDLESDNRTDQLILITLANVDSKKNQGFSEFLKSMGKESFPEIWLTSFEIRDNGSHIALQGKTFDAENIPKLIENLGQEPVFSGKTFEVFKLIRDEATKQISFTLQTDKSGEPK